MRLSDIPFEETRPPPTPTPPLADLWRGGGDRAAAARHWLRDPAVGVGRYGLHALFRALPVETTSAAGARLGDVFRRLNARSLAQARLVATIPRLRPDLAEPARRDATVAGWWRNTVRTLAECAHVDRLLDPERFEMVGREHLDRACRTGRPVIVVSVHLASWEASLRMLARYELCAPKDWFTVWMPQPNRFENEIVWRLRQRYRTYAFPPAPQTSRRMLGLLRSGTANLAILVDEPADGDVRFPLFGRSLPGRCNLRLVIALARHTNALLVPGYMERRGAARFRCHWLPATDTAEFSADEAGVQAVAARLSAQFEPVVLAHLEDWYMLHVLKLRDLPNARPFRASGAVTAPAGTPGGRPGGHENAPASW